MDDEARFARYFPDTAAGRANRRLYLYWVEHRELLSAWDGDERSLVALAVIGTTQRINRVTPEDLRPFMSAFDRFWAWLWPRRDMALRKVARRALGRYLDHMDGQSLAQHFDPYDPDPTRLPPNSHQRAQSTG